MYTTYMRHTQYMYVYIYICMFLYVNTYVYHIHGTYTLNICIHINVFICMYICTLHIWDIRIKYVYIYVNVFICIYICILHIWDIRTEYMYKYMNIIICQYICILHIWVIRVIHMYRYKCIYMYVCVYTTGHTTYMGYTHQIYVYIYEKQKICIYIWMYLYVYTIWIYWGTSNELLTEEIKLQIFGSPDWIAFLSTLLSDGDARVLPWKFRWISGESYGNLFESYRDSLKTRLKVGSRSYMKSELRQPWVHTDISIQIYPQYIHICTYHTPNNTIGIWYFYHIVMFWMWYVHMCIYRGDVPIILQTTL